MESHVGRIVTDLSEMDARLSRVSKILTERGRQYGDHAHLYAEVAGLWSSVCDKELTAEDVMVMMIHLKLARLRSGTPTADSIDDIIGYTALLGDLMGL